MLDSTYFERYPSRFPLVKHIAKGIRPLPQLALASFSLFFAAHAVLFKLYLPSRYTVYSLRILMALLAGITLTVILDAVLHFGEQRSPWRFGRQFLALALTVFIGATLLLYPGVINLTGEWRFFLNASYIVGENLSLYEFLRKQPKDTLIASLAEEASVLPAFTQRSVLVSREHAVPYHVGYYQQFRQRVANLIRAHYSQNLAEVQDLIQKYGIDFLMLERNTLTLEYVAVNPLIRQYQQTALKDDQLVKIVTQATENFNQGITPALANLTKHCAAFETENLVLLQATCIMDTPQQPVIDVAESNLLQIDAPYGMTITGLSSIEQSTFATSWRWGLGSQTTLSSYLAESRPLELAFSFVNPVATQDVSVEINQQPLKTISNIPAGETISSRLQFQGVAELNQITFTYSDWNHHQITFVPQDSRAMALQFQQLSLSPT